MSEMEAIAALHRDMTRQGPGTPEDVQWALSRLELPERPRICDAGCGPGADLETLAEALPLARIHGAEMMPHLVEEARMRAARFSNVTVEVGDMGALNGPYDLIWSAGAIYFLGVTEALELWRPALATGGVVAFSEPALEVGASQPARDFWADYPAITDLAGVEARIAAAAYEVLDHRMMTGMAWAGYYTELARRVAELRPDAESILSGILDATEREISLWRQAPGDVAYALMLVRPRLRTS